MEMFEKLSQQKKRMHLYSKPQKKSLRVASFLSISKLLLIISAQELVKKPYTFIPSNGQHYLFKEGCVEKRFCLVFSSFWNGSHAIPFLCRDPFFHQNITPQKCMLGCIWPILYFSFCQKTNLHLYKQSRLSTSLFKQHNKVKC